MAMQTTTGADKLLTLSELGDFLGLKKTACYSALHAGQLPPGLRIGRNLRFRKETVIIWLSSLEGPPSVDPIQSHRGEKAVGARASKPIKNKKIGRPTKKEKIEGCGS